MPLGTRDDPASWLANGPDRAPVELLGAVVARSRATGQRPAFVASLLGAPSGTATWRGISAARLWLTAAAATLALLSAIAVAGMSRREALVVVPPSSGPSLPASPRPTDVPPPGATLDPLEIPGSREELFNGALALTGLARGTLEEGSGQAILENETIRVVVDRWPVGVPRPIPGLGGAIDGDTIEALASATADLIGSQPRLSGFRSGTLSVDFIPAPYWVLPPSQIHADETTPFEVLVVVYEGNAYSFVGFARRSESPGARLVDFGRVVTSIDFLEPFEHVGLSGGISVAVQAGNHVATSTADLLVIENSGLTIFARSLTIHRTALGAPLELGPIARGGSGTVALAGASLDEYAASLTAADPAHFPEGGRGEVHVGGVLGFRWRVLTGSETILGPAYADVVLVVAGSDVFVFVGALEMVDDVRFLPRRVTPSSESTVSGTVGDLHLTMPRTWTISTAANGLFVTDAEATTFFSISQRITMLEPGGSVLITRPTPGSSAASFTVTGRTLEEVVASIDAGLPDVERQETTIGGEPAYRWFFPQIVAFQILTGVAVLEWRGAFYLFQQHYPIDGAPGDTFGLLLRGVELL